MGRRARRGRVNTEALIERERRRIAELLRDWPPDAVESVVDAAFTAWQEPKLRRKFGWRWNPRLRTTIGRALLKDGVVELNPLLLARHPGETRKVVIHEFAHLVAFRRARREPAHGPTWRTLMRAAGAPVRASHTLPVEDLRRH